MDINLHDYIFRQTKEGKYFRFRLEDGFMTGMGDNGYRFIVNETLFPQKMASLFDEWIHGYLSNKLTNDMTYGVGNFKFEINEGSLQLNCMTELGGSFYEFEYCCLSDNVLRELFRNQGPSEYSEVFVGLNFEYEFNYISNTWEMSGFEDSYFYDSDGNTEKFDFSKIQINCLKKKIYEEIKDYSLEEIGLEKGNISKKIVSVDSSIIVSEYISFIVPVIKP
jgi:hypothetical protein